MVSRDDGYRSPMSMALLFCIVGLILLWSTRACLKNDFSTGLDYHRNHPYIHNVKSKHVSTTGLFVNAYDVIQSGYYAFRAQVSQTWTWSSLYRFCRELLYSLTKLEFPPAKKMAGPDRIGSNFVNRDEVGRRTKGFQTAELNGIHAAYYCPVSVDKVRGVALLLHACGQKASDWFQLPEHRHIAAQLVRKKLALLSLTSPNRITGCWSTRFPPWENDDVQRVASATKQWAAEQSFPPNIPIHAVGVSSGATMLSVLSTSNLLPNIVNQALYISPGNLRALQNASALYPNTLFVHLATDEHFASSTIIASARQILLERNVGLVGELSLRPVPLLSSTLHEREPRISANLSQQIFAAAEASGRDILQLMQSSERTPMINLLRQKEMLRSVQQVLRVINGYHEASSQQADLVADWLVHNAGHPRTSKE